MDWRRVAGILAVGWYLLTPPIKWGPLYNNAGTGRKQESSSLPLSEWEHLASFDSAQQRELYRATLFADMNKKITSGHIDRNSLEGL